MAEKNKNEERNWEVNYELGILDPMVEDLEQLPGGRMSRENEWYPLKNEWEMQAALMLVEKAEILTKGAGSFGLWWLRSWENRKLGENRYLSYLVMMLQGCPNVIILYLIVSVYNDTSETAAGNGLSAKGKEHASRCPRVDDQKDHPTPRSRTNHRAVHQ
jgi:hypothetical protein